MKRIPLMRACILALLLSCSLHCLADFIVGDIIYYSTGYGNDVTVRGSTNKNITELNIPSSVRYNGQDYDVCFISDNAFANCKELTTVSINTSLYNLGHSAFDGCSKLKTFSVLSVSDYIGMRAFYGCSSLESVNISSSLKSIYQNAFYGCINLKECVIASWGNLELIDSYAFAGCSKLESITLPDKLTTIGNFAFSGCLSLSSIAIPAKVTSIGTGAFENCSALSSITVSLENTKYNNGNNCNALIENKTGTILRGCKNTVFNSSMKIIGQGAFSGSSIEEIYIPKTITQISGNAFYGCNNLKNILVDSQNTVYDSRANCNAIVKTSTNTITVGCANTIIPETIQGIGYFAFGGCSALTNIVIPGSVENIGQGAFSGCSNLISITNFAIEPQSVQQNAFYGVDNATLHVKKGYKTAYENSDQWNSFTIIDDADNPIIPVEFTVTVSSTDETMGSVSGSGKYEEGSEVTLSAMPNEGYEFVKWSDETTENPYTFIVNDNVTITATFKKKQSAPIPDDPTESDIEPSTDMSAYPNAVYLEDVESRAGDFNLNLMMKNEEENITAFQCDVYLPDGVTWKYTTDKRGKIVYDLPAFNEDRTDDSYHTITPIAKNADGSYNIIVYSNELEVILENEGTLMTLPLEISEDMESGDYNIFLKNVVLSTPDQQQTLIDKLVSKLTIPSYTVGDANGDGLINVTDIVTVIAHIRGAEPANFIQAAADINEDNLINVTDIVGIIAIIRNASNPAAAKSIGSSLMAKAAKSASDDDCNLEVIPFTVAEGTTSSTVKLDMNNPGNEFTAFQCDIVFPEGISWATTVDKRGNKKITQPTFDSEADRTDATYHTIDTGLNTDGSINIMVYSTDLEVILDEAGAVLDMPFVYDANLTPGVYDIEIKNMVLTRKNQTDVKPANYKFSVMVGSPTDSSIKLNGHFTEEAIAEFKNALKDNANVSSIDMTGATTSEDVTITSGNKNALVFVKEGTSVENPNNVIVGDVCANLVLTDGGTFSAPRTFTATNATYERSMTNTWGTIMLPYEVKSDETVEYYIPTGVANNVLVLEKQETLPANTPALVAKKSGDKIQSNAANVTVSAEAGSSVHGTVTMYGSYENNKKVTDADAYYIKNNAFVRCNGYFFIDAFRSYFTVSGGASAKTIGIPGFEATAIEALLNDDKSNAVNYYDESGRQMNGLKSGMNIMRLSNGQVIKVKR